MKEVRYNDKLWFGKNKGVRICDLISNDPNYIKTLIKDGKISLDEKSKEKLSHNSYSSRFTFDDHQTGIRYTDDDHHGLRNPYEDVYEDARQALLARSGTGDPVITATQEINPCGEISIDVSFTREELDTLNSMVNYSPMIELVLPNPNEDNKVVMKNKFHLVPPPPPKPRSRKPRN